MMRIPIYIAKQRENITEKTVSGIICPFCGEKTTAAAIRTVETSKAYGLLRASATTNRVIMFNCCQKGIKVKPKYYKYIANYIDAVRGSHYAVIKTLTESLGRTSEGNSAVEDYIRTVGNEYTDIRDFISEADSKNGNSDMFEKKEYSKLCIASLICIFFAPFLSFILGIAGTISCKREFKKGMWMGITGIIMSVLSYVGFTILMYL